MLNIWKNQPLEKKYQIEIYSLFESHPCLNQNYFWLYFYKYKYNIIWNKAIIDTKLILLDFHLVYNNI